MHLRRLIFVALAFFLGVLPGEAQPERFVEAVRDLATSASVDVGRRAPIAPLIDRMAAALAEWDRDISALRARTSAELQGASDQRVFQLHVELGLAYRRRGTSADALREFDAAAARMPRASDIHVLRGLTFEAAGDVESAKRAFNTAWSLDPENPIKAYYVVFHRSGTDLGHARQVLAAAYQRGLKGGQKGAPFLTLDVLGNTLRMPVVGDATLGRGFALLAEGRYSEAVEALRRSSASSPSNDSALAHFTRARSYEAENRIAEARREYEAAMTGTLAGRSVLYVGMGRLAQVEGDYDNAIDLLMRAVRLSPNDPIMHRELASAFAAADRIDDAFAELVAALLIDPGDALTTAALGQLFVDSGRYADAVSALTRTLQLAPDRFEAHYALGSAMTHLGRTSDAAREFELFERARQQMVDKRRSDLDSGGGR
ncbi:MAG TPA: tetratricopeptide repeat protein [Vicinamibacterales bacterium]